MTFAPIEIAPHWADLNEHLCELVALVPEDRLDEAPPGEWGVRAIAGHIIGARDHWLANSINDGAGFEARPVATTALVRASLRASWDRMGAFLADAAALEAEYRPPPNDPEYVDPERFTGHYVAFHRLAHDVHHRAQLLDRMRELGIDVPPSIQRRPL